MFEEAVNKINGQNDKHVQKHVQELRDGNTACSQPIRFICPGTKAKLIILQFKPTNEQNFIKTAQYYEATTHTRSRAKKLVRKRVGFKLVSITNLMHNFFIP